MTTAAQRLVELSGLLTGAAADHLIAISQSGQTAAERLLSRSTLPSATAGVHLLQGIVVSGIAFIELRSFTERRRI